MPDVNSKWRDYVVALKVATPAGDLTTLVMADLPVQRAKSAEAAKDLNTAYLLGLP